MSTRRSSRLKTPKRKKGEGTNARLAGTNTATSEEKDDAAEAMLLKTTSVRASYRRSTRLSTAATASSSTTLAEGNISHAAAENSTASDDSAEEASQKNTFTEYTPVADRAMKEESIEMVKIEKHRDRTRRLEREFESRRYVRRKTQRKMISTYLDIFIFLLFSLPLSHIFYCFILLHNFIFAEINYVSLRAKKSAIIFRSTRMRT